MGRLTGLREKINTFIKADIFDECRDHVERENARTLHFLNLCLMVFSLFFCIRSYLNQTEHYLYKYIYTIFFLAAFIFWALTKRLEQKPEKKVYWCILLYDVMVFLYFVVTNVFYNRETCITSYYVLMTLAFLFLMKPVRMILLQIAVTVILIMLICLFKAENCVETDVLNAVLMMVINIVFGSTVLQFRMDALEKLEEKEQALSEAGLYQEILGETQTAVYVYETATQKTIYTNRVAKERIGENCPAEFLGREETLPEEQKFGNRFYARKEKNINWYGKEAKVLYLTDVTDSRKIREQMRRAHEQLQKRYQEELLYRAKSVSEDVLSTSRLNLTRGIVEEMRVGNVEGYEKEYRYVMGFADRMAAYTKKLCLTEEQNRRLSREGLLKLFEEGETSISEEYVAELQDNRHVWIRVEANLLKRPETSEIMAFIYNRDITQERKLKHILESLMSFGYDEIYTIDISYGRFAAVAIGQYALVDQQSKGWYEAELATLMERAVLPEDKEKIHNELSLSGIQRNLEEKPTHVVEVSLISKNGKARRKQIRCVYLNGEVGVVLFTLTDIEDLVKEEKQKQNRLEQALTMAREANAAKSNFLASMSHEIRTPMNAIIGLNSIIKENIGNREQVLDCTEKLDSASKYLLSLLNDILDMSRIESGNMTLSHQPFDGNKFWDNVNILAKAQADPASIHYIFERKCAISQSYIGDATRLEQIMINLINNAIKFTPAGGYVKVSVRETEELRNRAQILMDVEDNGIGISAEFMPELFGIFTQEHAGNTTAYKGSGLGLSIARNFARMMDGDITVESVEGQGSIFHVKVMLDIDRGSEPMEELPEENRVLDFTGKKVLLAEDHPLNTLVAKQLLAKKGFTVVHAENGEEALRAFMKSEEEEYDAVLMDIRMPIMDGIEATKKIRDLFRADAKKIPIIAMTANAYDEDRRITKEAGMNAHLAKPIDPQQLFETLDRFINKF